MTKSPMRASEESGARIRAEAAAFVARRHSGVARGEDERALDAWRTEDPAHEAAYAEAEALWQSLGSLDALASRQLAEARAYGARVTRRREVLRQAGLGLAAGLVLAILLLPSPWPDARHEHIRTGLGERRTVWLGDGTTIDINTNSELTVDTGWRHRTAQLLRGEALFSVAPSWLAPFAVAAGEGKIRDLGTRFGVRIEGEEISVYVLDGEVSIETSSGARSAALGPEHRQKFRRSGSLVPAEPTDAGATAAWANGQLVVRSLPLGAVLTELSRYHKASVTLAGPGLEGRVISGIVPINDLPSALETIARALEAKLTQLGTGGYALSVAEPQRLKR